MRENPAVVRHLVPGVFEMDGALRAEEQGALQARQGGARVRGAGEVYEGDGSRRAARAARQQPQPREPGAAATHHITLCPTPYLNAHVSVCCLTSLPRSFVEFFPL